MSSSLFRPEAIEAQRARIWSDVTLQIPVSLTICVAFLVLSVVALVTYASTGTYARKQHVPGFLAARQGTANILAARGGVISVLHVKEGDVVRQGAPLLTIKVEQDNLAGLGAETTLIDSLQEQEKQIEQQLTLEAEQTNASGQRLRTEIDALSQDIATLQQQKVVQEQRTAIAHDQVANITDLVARNVISKAELKRRQDALLAAQQAAIDLDRTVAAKASDRAGKADDLNQLPLASRERRSRLEAERNDLQLKIRQFDAQRAYVVTAPKDGRVSALQAWIGKTVEPNVPQMTIVPIDDPLTAELFVPAQAIGFIAPGQTVYLGYASFPYQQYGFGEGTVESVAYTLLKPEQSAGPIALSAPAYRVTVALKQQSIAAYGRDVPLQADMQLSADIILDRRNLITWLLDPLYASWRRPT